jgi:hypothetical protein
MLFIASMKAIVFIKSQNSIEPLRETLPNGSSQNSVDANMFSLSPDPLPPPKRRRTDPDFWHHHISVI